MNQTGESHIPQEKSASPPTANLSCTPANKSEGPAKLPGTSGATVIWRANHTGESQSIDSQYLHFQYSCSIYSLVNIYTSNIYTFYSHALQVNIYTFYLHDSQVNIYTSNIYTFYSHDSQINIYISTCMHHRPILTRTIHS